MARDLLGSGGVRGECEGWLSVPLYGRSARTHVMSRRKEGFCNVLRLNSELNLKIDVTANPYLSIIRPLPARETENSLEVQRVYAVFEQRLRFKFIEVRRSRFGSVFSPD